MRRRLTVAALLLLNAQPRNVVGTLQLPSPSALRPTFRSLFSCPSVREVNGNSVSTDVKAPLCRKEVSNRALLPQAPLLKSHSLSNNQSLSSSQPVFSVQLVAREARVSFFDEHYKREDLDLDTDISLPPATAATDGTKASHSTPRADTLVWAFNGTIPGPTLRARKGDILEVTVRNFLPTSIGFFLPGIVASREPIEGGFVRPGATKVFRIPLQYSGLFRYVSSVDGATQVASGLFGTLLVHDNDQVDANLENALVAPSNHTVVMVDDVWLNEQNLQIILPAKLTALERAEMSHNGRRGNVLCVNGKSISNGYEVRWKANTLQQVSFLNNCSIRPLRVSFPGLYFSVTSAWAGFDAAALSRTDADSRKSTLISQESFAVPAGGTAEFVIQIPADKVGQTFELLVQDVSNPAEMRAAVVSAIPSIKERPPGPTSGDNVLSLTLASPPAASGDVRTVVADMVLLPSTDGIATSADGFMDAKSIGSRQLAKHAAADSVSDVVLHAKVCSNREQDPCPRLLWDFNTSIIPPDAQLHEASFIFEMLCPADSTKVESPSTIAIELWGVVRPASLDSRTAVNEMLSDLTIPLGKQLAACNPAVREVSVDFNDLSLMEYIASPGANNLHLSATFRTVNDADSDAPIDLPVASIAATNLPPPNLRIVFKTRHPELLITAAAFPMKQSTLLTKQRRIEQVYHELQVEQETVKLHLRALYERVKRRQNGGGVQYVVNATSTQQLSLFNSLEKRLIVELARHTKQQEQQTTLEKKLLVLHTNASLPQLYKAQLIAELQRQLESIYLQQKLHQREMSKILAEVAASSPQTKENDLAGAGQPSHFRGSAELSDVEKRALRREKQLYIKLYRHYCSLITAMKQLKATSDKLRVSLSSPDAYLAASAGETLRLEPPSPEQIRAGALDSFLLAAGEPQSLFHIQVGEPIGPDEIEELEAKLGRKLAVPTLPTRSPRPLHANMLQRFVDGNESRWVNTESDEEAARVIIHIGQSLHADVTGRVPMWITAVVRKPKDRSLLRAGDFVVWEIENSTPFTHTLYFHRALLEIFEEGDVNSNGDFTQSKGPVLAANNGHQHAVTVLGTGNGEVRRISRALAVVPRMIPSRTEPLGAHGSPSGDSLALFWDIRIGSTCREHAANGLTTRVRLEVAVPDSGQAPAALLPIPKGSPSDAAVASKNIVALSGIIDFSPSDEFFEDNGGHYFKTRLAVWLLLLVVGGGVFTFIVTRGLRKYQEGQRVKERRHDKDDDYLSARTPSPGQAKKHTTFRRRIDPPRDRATRDASACGDTLLQSADRSAMLLKHRPFVSPA